MNFTTTYDASTLFIYHLLKHNLQKSDIWCSKDPLYTDQLPLINRLLPNAKIIVMVRDGRASVYSLLKNNNYDISPKAFIKDLKAWNTMYEKIVLDCQIIGAHLCKIVRYEDLVDDIEKSMRNICRHLGIQFTPAFLNHQQFVGKKIILENVKGWSSDQVVKSIYKDSKKTW